MGPVARGPVGVREDFLKTQEQLQVDRNDPMEGVEINYGGWEDEKEKQRSLRTWKWREP